MSSLQWENLKPVLHPWLYEAVVSLDYTSMTPIQASTIPLFSQNKDVIVESVTGSGKTFSFVVPVLQHVSNRLYGAIGSNETPVPLRKGHFIGVVIAPTRELANQIKEVFDRVIEFLPEEKMPPIRTQLVVGSLSSTRENLDHFLSSRNQILVGTPGRLSEILSSSKISPASVEIVVLDEADRLLDLSFEAELESILKVLPKQRRTGLFSATLSAAGDRVFRTGMLNPVRISAQNKGTLKAAPSSLSIQYMLVEPERKISTFLRLVKDYRFKKCIAYFPTCASVKLFQNILKQLGTLELDFLSFHGQLTMPARMKTLAVFTDGNSSEKRSVLMTTDVAARGIDVPDVDLVIQLEPPTDPDMFLHRCGRTGRANRAGRALVFLNKGTTEEDYVNFMEVKDVAMTEMNPPETDDLHQQLSSHLKNYILEDRARHEAAVKAYVGFVRYYQKHIASSIFRLQHVDYLGVARMYGLLRLPKMPETRYIPSDKFPEKGWLTDVILDMDKFAYADKVKERARLESLEETKLKLAKDAKSRKLMKKKNEAWSSKVENKDSKAARREKSQKKREAIQQQLLGELLEEEGNEHDWKEMVRRNKKQKAVVTVQGSFDDL